MKGTVYKGEGKNSPAFFFWYAKKGQKSPRMSCIESKALSTLFSYQVLMLITNQETFTTCCLQAEKAKTLGGTKIEDKKGLEDSAGLSAKSSLIRPHFLKPMFIFGGKSYLIRHASVAWASGMGQMLGTPAWCMCPQASFHAKDTFARTIFVLFRACGLAGTHPVSFLEAANVFVYSVPFQDSLINLGLTLCPSCKRASWDLWFYQGVSFNTATYFPFSTLAGKSPLPGAKRL